MRNEFVFQRLLPPVQLVEKIPTINEASVKEGQIMTILDVKGVSVTEITTDVIRWIIGWYMWYCVLVN
jgi:5-bromo-4-chloroindolyl phosphate hydrolysis protein